MADPDLELRGGGGGGREEAVLIFLPCWPFSLQSFLLVTQNKGGPRDPPLDPPLGKRSLQHTS